MAIRKISDLTAATSAADDDLVQIVDVSDTTYGSTGTNKKIEVADLFAGRGGNPTALKYTVEADGEDLAKGDPVHITGENASGQPTVEKARADTAAKMPAQFVMNEAVTDGNTGEAILVGEITGVNTSSFNSGDVLYVAPTGGYTTTKPGGSNLVQNIAIVEHVDATDGTGFVTGAARANDVPNITAGKFLIGTATNPAESAYTMPTADGAAGQVLKTNGAGAVTFEDASGGGSDKWRIFGSSNVGHTGAARYIGLRGNYVDTSSIQIYSQAMMPEDCELIKLTMQVGVSTTVRATVSKNGTTSVYTTGNISFTAGTPQTFTPTGTSISQGDLINISVQGSLAPGDVHLVMTFQAT